MNSRYVFAADDSVVEFFSGCTKREREDLLRLFRSLADSPHQRGDWLQKGRSGREFQVKRFGRWLVTFWPDDPVLELRVVDLKKVAP
jgi:hypothetical protein